MQERWITVDGLSIRAIEVSPDVERDDPVLMIHGLAGWAENWRPVMPAIAASGRRALAIDLPGFGRSERPRRVRYFDPESPFYARIVFGALDALGVPRAHLAGHSFGGAVAFTSAVWLPERVRSLVLIAPGGLGRDLLRSFRLLTLPGAAFLAGLRATPAISRAVLYSCFYDPSRCPEEVVQEAVRYARSAIAETVSVLRATVTFRGGIRPEVREPWLERRARYHGPALIVWGREDAILPASEADLARELSARAEVKLIPRCGHLVMVERPDELLGELLPFLERSSSTVARWSER